MKLKGQKILVLGGSSGIGLAIAKGAVEAGAVVIIAGRSLEKLEKARLQIEGQCDILQLDIGNESAVSLALKELGTLNHVVTTAANLTYGPISTLPREAIDEMIATKLLGPIFIARHAKVDPEGSYLFLSGLAASKPGAGTSIVAAVNAGLEGLGRALAVELAPIRVNVISPGVTETPGWDFIPAENRVATFKQIAESLPARRIGAPEDIAEAALMILQNRFTTGTVHHVDGGGRLA